MADGIDLTDFFARLRNSLLDLSRRLQFNASEDTLDFVSFRLQQILQHLVHFGGGLDGVPQSITDVRPFSVRVILSLVEGSGFCSLKAKQTNALVHVFLRWKYGENAAGCLLPLPLCFHYPAGPAMPQTTAYNQKFFCAPPRQYQPYSEALSHFLQIQQLLENSVLFAR